MSDEVVDIVQTAIEALAVELGYDNLRRVTAETPLFGGEQGVDSLTLVRLIADIERAAEDKLGKRILLADERAMSQRYSPFRTVGSLSEFVRAQLMAASNA